MSALSLKWIAATARQLSVAVVVLSAVTARSAAQRATPTNNSVAPPALPTTLTSLRWRHIGPAAYGGRIADLAVDPANPSVIYVGAASGGIFKSINRGATWTPVFDATNGSQSIGALAIAPSDPEIVWAGTGEANNRQSTSWGNGVYRSTDGGRSWEPMGLEDSHHIGRIVIHPADPNVVWVAAVGHLWGPNEERGLYRTRDGGKTWEKVLAIDRETGVTDVLLDPDGRTLLAASYQRRRRGFGFVGGGPGSAIHRSTDGGDTWTRLDSGAGLPAGDIGRIGLAQAPSDVQVMYSIVEHRTNGGVYRSDDRGRTWKRRNPLNPRPMYYSNIRVDPANPDRLWVLDAYLWKSTDGGRTFSSDSTGIGVHVDHHAMWINPRDPVHMLLGNDGGLYFTHDGARSWSFIDNLPIGQYYDISVDNRTPYMVYGGTQDNGTWALPSRTFSEGGIRNSDIVHLAYGDGFNTIPDPANPRYVYANSQNGRAYVVDLETKEQRLIRPAPADTTTTYRFTWSTPNLVSPHDPSTYYYGGERLFRTRDRGQSWEAISPDLSRRENWQKIPIMGVVRDSTTLSRDDGVSDYGTITTISESPRRAGMLLVGTDDGLVHMSSDAGKNWSDITSRFRLPGARWVRRVLASQHDAQIAYVAFDGHQDDDFTPYLFKTSDGGRSWAAIAGGLPAGHVIKAVAEHPDNAQVLIVGTEFGVVFSYDGGRSWKQAWGNLPRVPVDDIVVHPVTRDIVLGTHGRSLIILDDTRLLAEGDPETGPALRLATPSPAVMAYRGRDLPAAGAGRFAGDNPAPGATITYVIPTGASQATDSATLIIRAPDGNTVRELSVPSKPGVHRVNWDLRYALPYVPIAADAVWFGPPKGVWVLPGTYSVVLRTGHGERTTTLDVRSDPRATISREHLAARHAAGMEVNELLRAWRDADRTLAQLEREVTPLPGAPVDTAAPYPRRVRELRTVFRSGWLSLKSRVLDLHGAVQGASAPPTEGQSRTLQVLRAEMTHQVAGVNEAIGALSQWRAGGSGPRGVPDRVRPPGGE